MIVIEKLLGWAFFAIAVMLAIDVADDVSHGADLSHVVLEIAALSISVFILGTQIFRHFRHLETDRASVAALARDLEVDRDLWRANSERYLAGLGAAIDQQFDRWELSDSEREIGLLILKGLTHKEIAVIRTTSEQTVRQQAAAIYRKGGLEGKSQLAAFFLEDLMLPSVK